MGYWRSPLKTPCFSLFVKLQPYIYLIHHSFSYICPTAQSTRAREPQCYKKISHKISSARIRPCRLNRLEKLFFAISQQLWSVYPILKFSIHLDLLWVARLSVFLFQRNNLFGVRWCLLSLVSLTFDVASDIFN